MGENANKGGVNVIIELSGTLVFGQLNLMTWTSPMSSSLTKYLHIEILDLYTTLTC